MHMLYYTSAEARPQAEGCYKYIAVWRASGVLPSKYTSIVYKNDSKEPYDKSMVTSPGIEPGLLG